MLFFQLPLANQRNITSHPPLVRSCYSPLDTKEGEHPQHVATEFLLAKQPFQPGVFLFEHFWSCHI